MSEKLGVLLLLMWKEIFSQVLIEQSRLGEADNNGGWGRLCGAMGVGRGSSQVGRGLFGGELRPWYIKRGVWGELKNYGCKWCGVPGVGGRA